MINEALKLTRVFHNLKQKDLAEALGLSPSYLNEIESGKKQVTVEILQKYSDYFHIPVSSLLYFAEQRTEAKPTTNPIATKVLKMLDWVHTIAHESDDALDVLNGVMYRRQKPIGVLKNPDSFSLGRQAFHLGRSINDNPYNMGTVQCAKWRAGFIAARRWPPVLDLKA